MEHKRFPQRFTCLGLCLTHPVDNIPAGKFPFLKNVRAYQTDRIEPRPGVANIAACTAAANPVHSIRRLNDYTLTAPNNWTLVVGNATELLTGTTSLTQRDTGYSGDPLALVPLRPTQSARPWMYVADRSRMRKVLQDGTLHSIGLPPPSSPPVAVMFNPQINVVDCFEGYSDDNDLQDGVVPGTPPYWTEGGDATDDSSTIEDRVVANDIVAIQFDYGVEGWCSIIPTSIVNVRSRMILRINHGNATAENVIVHSVHKASTSTTIAGILYESGTSGLCSIALVTPLNDITVDGIVQIAGAEYCRVLAVSTGPDGTQCIRVSTTGTRAATNAVVAVNSFRCFCVNTHVAAEHLWAQVMQNVITKATGKATFDYTPTGSVIDLSSIVSGVATQPDDYFRLGFNINDLTVVEECRIYFDIDETVADQDFQHNAYMYAWRPSDLAGALMGTETLLSGRETGIHENLVDTSPTGKQQLQAQLDRINKIIEDMINDPNIPDPYKHSPLQDLYRTRDNIEQMLKNLPDEGTGTGGGTSEPIGTGEAQWFELEFRIREMIRIGSDTSRSLRTVNKIRLEFTFTGNITIQIGNLYLTGGYGCDTEAGGYPHVYRYRGRVSSTGAKGNWSPAVRAGVSPKRQINLIFPTAHPTTECNQLDIQRFGGGLLEWHYVGTLPNQAARVITGATNATPIEITSAAHGWATGDYVLISGVAGTTSANGVWRITRTGTDTFTLDGSVGNGAYSGSGATAVLGFADKYSDSVAAVNESELNVNFQPWPVVGSPVSGTSAANGVCGTILQDSATTFSTSWSPGTRISINGIPYIIYRVISTSKIELTENAGFKTASVWNIDEPILMAQPLPCLWGPFEGFTFACGDAYNPGWLYFTKGNDPDTTTETHKIEVTSPSEALMNGCIYNGRCYVFSSERMFVIYPTFNEPNLFRAAEVPNGKGMFNRWGLAVGNKIWFISKDGIYETEGAEPRSITNEDLYPLFPHEGQVGVAVNNFTAPYMAETTALRLAYGNNEVFFDYADGLLSGTGVRRSMVYLTNVGGWFPDQYDAGSVTCHYFEEGSGVNRLLIGLTETTTGYVTYATGTADLAAAIACQVITPALDFGDWRPIKRFSECALDLETYGTQVKCQVWLNSREDRVHDQTFINHTRTREIMDLGEGEWESGRNISLEITWSASTVSPKLYTWEPSVLVDPELTQLRGTDYDDCGYAGRKQVRAIMIEADTSNVSRSIKIIRDNDVLQQTIDVQHDGRLTQTYELTPFEAHRVRILPNDAGNWTLFSVQWIADQKPEHAALYTDWTDDGFPGPKWMQGILLDADTKNTDVTVTFQYDQDFTGERLVVRHDGRRQIFYPFPSPFRAHMLRIVPNADLMIFGVKWVYSQHPEKTQFINDWTNDGYEGEKFLQGLVIDYETGGEKYHDEPAQIMVEVDGEKLTVFGLEHYTRKIQPQSFQPPVIGYLFRIIPVFGDVRIFNVTWIWKRKDHYTDRVEDWDNDNVMKPKFLQGIVVDCDTKGNNALVDIKAKRDDGTWWTETITLNHAVQQEKPYAFANPPIVYSMQFYPQVSNYLRLYKIRWIYEVKEDKAALVGDWEDGGMLGPKWVQGIYLECDTDGAPVPITIQYDGGLTGAVITANHAKQMVQDYSFSKPFFAHMMKCIPEAPLRMYRHWWIYEPAPPLGDVWWTPPMTFGDGFATLLWMQLSHISSSDLTVVAIVDGDEKPAITVPHGWGVHTKSFVRIPPWKGKSWQFKIRSGRQFRLYKQDCEVRVSRWAGEVVTVQPFGNVSLESGAKI